MEPARLERGELVTVIGCGVIGLSCAIRLRELGHRVRIVSHRRTPRTTSDVAAAFWYPFHIEGDRKLLRRLAERTHETFRAMPDFREAGITFTDGREFFEHELSNSELRTSFWWRDFPGIDFRPLPKRDIPTTYAFRSGVHFNVPVVHMPTYLRFLESRFTRQLGGRIDKRVVVPGDLEKLLKESAVVVNCTGLGSRELVSDSAVYPIQGQIVCTKPIRGWDGLVFITTGRLNPLYVVPRGTRDIVLGGTTEDDVWSTRPSMAVCRAILSRCATVFPELKAIDIEDKRVIKKVGLRPARHHSVRINKDPKLRGLIHCYGHGGSGVTLSWGSAEEVARIAKEFI